MNKRNIQDLHELQALPLKLKIKLTKQRLREWVKMFGIDGVFVSFSGGKDSAVLLDIARGMYPDILAVFVDTGLEYPEIRQFVKTYDNVEWLKPKLNFKQVILKYGYPFISKEVAGCVYGARKYVKSVLQGGTTTTTTINLLDRVSIQPPITRGGYDSKYRKLRGIYEYSKEGFSYGEDCSSKKWVNSSHSKYSGITRQAESDSGEYS